MLAHIFCLLKTGIDLLDVLSGNSRFSRINRKHYETATIYNSYTIIMYNTYMILRKYLQKKALQYTSILSPAKF